MLATRGVTVIYVTLPSNLQILSSRFQGLGDLPVYFQDISVPESPLPPDLQNLNKISREIVPNIIDLIHKMLQPFEGLMAELRGSDYYESRGLPPPDRLVLISDPFMSWSATVAAKLGVRSFTFNTMSAHMWLCLEAMFWDRDAPPTMSEVADAVGSLVLPDVVVAEIRQQMDSARLADGLLLNTFMEMEPKFLRHLERIGVGSRGGGGKPVWAVGPTIDLPSRDKIQGARETEIVEWLDRQTPGSAVYVSFGTESYISPAQVTELAVGLEASGQPFLWVMRPPESSLAKGGSSLEWKAELLPEGYERRLEGRCLIETGWAPQAAILAHEATGAFITHCGWNSVQESVAAGVPMIALPLQSDQPANALLLAKEAKLAVEMKISEGVAKRDEVEKAVRKLMLTEAEEMKQRVKDVGKAAIAAISEEGGAAWKRLDSFIEYVCIQTPIMKE
jgi:hypothetical protein